MGRLKVEERGNTCWTKAQSGLVRQSRRASPGCGGKSDISFQEQREGRNGCVTMGAKLVIKGSCVGFIF